MYNNKAAESRSTLSALFFFSVLMVNVFTFTVHTKKAKI